MVSFSGQYHLNIGQLSPLSINLITKAMSSVYSALLILVTKAVFIWEMGKYKARVILYCVSKIIVTIFTNTCSNFTYHQGCLFILTLYKIANY